jgi:Zn-dependent peptidase ImmA (M78 family)
MEAVVTDKNKLSIAASELRGRFGEDIHSPIDVFRMAHMIEELTLVFYPLGERLSGLCLREGKYVLIAVNSTMTYGRQRVALAHEFYHYFYDEMTTAVCALDIAASVDVEREANLFASYFLAPPLALAETIKTIKAERGALNLPGIIQLEQSVGMSRQSMLFRLMEEGELSQQVADTMLSPIISQALALGYDEMLYHPLSVYMPRMTYGRYIKQADELLQRELISEGKFAELLLEAFRSELANKLNEAELLD